MDDKVVQGDVGEIKADATLRLRFFFVGSWGSQLLCKLFFRFFMDQKKTRKPRTFSGGGGGGGG